MRTIALSLTLLALAVLVGCKGDPATPEYWSKAIGSAKTKKEKLRLVEELRSSKRATPAFLPMLHERLGQEKSADVKAAIARMVGEMKSPTSVQPLMEAADFGGNDSDIKALNKEIAIALGEIGDKKGASLLLKLMKGRDNFTVIAAIEALGRLRAPDALDQLIEIATDDKAEPFLSKKAIQAIGDLGEDPSSGAAKAVPALVKMMYSERRGISFYMESSFALYQIGTPSAEALLPVLKGEDKALLAWAKEKKIFPEALMAKAAQVLGDLHEARAEKTLIEKVNYNHDALDIKLFVRMRMADALGRMRSKAAVKALTGLLEEEEANARKEYARALARIGDREAIGALVKCAGKGSWEAREECISALTMLGDDREVAALEKISKDEATAFAAECKQNKEDDYDYPDCRDEAAGVKKHQEKIAGYQLRLTAAKDCKSDGACWSKKLDEKNEGVRERAAYEVGRSNKPELVDEFTKRLTEKNLDTRLAIIQGCDWLVTDNKEAGKRVQAALPGLTKQISEEKGKTEFVKVNEDLRRLHVKLERSA